MNTYWRSGSIAPRILNLGAGWKWVISFTPRPFYLPGKENRRYSLDRRLGGPQSRSQSDGEEKIPNPCRELNSDRPARSLVTILTELSRNEE
jgi:hypothetical protein